MSRVVAPFSPTARHDHAAAGARVQRAREVRRAAPRPGWPTPTPAAVESPSTSRRSGSGPSSLPSHGSAASGRRGAGASARRACASTRGPCSTRSAAGAQHRQVAAGRPRARVYGAARVLSRDPAGHDRMQVRPRVVELDRRPSSRASTPKCAHPLAERRRGRRRRARTMSTRPRPSVRWRRPAPRLFQTFIAMWWW